MFFTQPMSSFTATKRYEICGCCCCCCCCCCSCCCCCCCCWLLLVVALFLLFVVCWLLLLPFLNPSFVPCRPWRFSSCVPSALWSRAMTLARWDHQSLRKPLVATAPKMGKWWENPLGWRPLHIIKPPYTPENHLGIYWLYLVLKGSF